jgi:hypothetical protein
MRGPRGHAQEQAEQPGVAPEAGVEPPVTCDERKGQCSHRRQPEPKRLQPGHREQPDLRGEHEGCEPVAERDRPGGGFRYEQGPHGGEAQRLQPDEQPQQPCGGT